MVYQKILLTRLVSSVLCTVLLQIFPVTLYLFLTNIDVVHPVLWFQKTLITALSIRTWLYFSPLHGLILVVGVILSRCHTTPPRFASSRLQAFVNIFTKNTILRIFGYLLLGITTPWLYLGLNEESLTQQCSTFPKHTCLNERNVFVISSGLWTAFFYFIKHDLTCDKYLQFPVIQQLKFLQMRAQSFPVLKKSLKSSLVPVLYFLPVYYWNGSRFSAIFETFFKAQVETNSLSSFSGLLSPSLFLHIWLISSVFFMVLTTLEIMIQINLTEHYSFALIKQPNSSEILLSTALNEQNIMLIQYLAYYDLYVVSTGRKSLRSPIYTLSQPGGHPHTWNSILSECLKLINNFIGDIEIIYRVPEPPKLPDPLPRHIHVHDMTLRDQQICSGSVPLSPGCKLRNLVTPHQRTEIPQSKSKMDEFQARVNDYFAEVYKNSALSYVFGNLPDAKISFLVSNSQPIIWATQSIAELAANALTEDQFGIVLKDLPVIITSLLHLKLATDKMGNIQKKIRKHEHDICMKTALKSAVKRSLYKIAIAYCDYLNDLQLPPEIHSGMQNYVKFREC